jgi:hypothetical protein
MGTSGGGRDEGRDGGFRGRSVVRDFSSGDTFLSSGDGGSDSLKFSVDEWTIPMDLPSRGKQGTRMSAGSFERTPQTDTHALPVPLEVVQSRKRSRTCIMRARERLGSGRIMSRGM